ncbi:hydrolase [Mycolicibacterium litorale]|uniref:Hydrolase n=1 Tax=Mycolicibacterium litorale TaxID=758802 RepID=A0A6S6P6E7_9MYCO|nr:alpha/beta hydrolase [Mycolicibacterium litorale]BCI52240.1 hydrolase [Mycolicibacterium litorale]
MEHLVDVGDGVTLWAQDRGNPDGTPLLLIMGANSSGLTWPDELVEILGHRHRVIRYDHRDTGRSGWDFDRVPYAIADLADDAVAVLDALGIPRAHVVGMSMGGTLVQLLLLDHPDRLLSATVMCTSALGAGLAAGPEASSELPGPDPALLEFWSHMDADRDAADELDWRVEHWRMLNGRALPFDDAEFRHLEQRMIEHAGRHENPAAHARADQGGLDRGGELGAVTVPTLVIEAPEDPVNPPPHGAHLAAVIGGAQMVTVAGMGHALPRAVVEPVGAAILAHTGAVDSR